MSSNSAEAAFVLVMHNHYAPVWVIKAYWLMEQNQVRFIFVIVWQQCKCKADYLSLQWNYAGERRLVKENFCTVKCVYGSSGVLLHVWHEQYKAFYGSRGSCTWLIAFVALWVISAPGLEKRSCNTVRLIRIKRSKWETFFSTHLSSFSKPGAYITHDAT